MALPAIVSSRRPRKQNHAASPSHSSTSERDAAPHERVLPSKSTVKAATRVRFIFSLTSSLLFFISLVFLILVEIGNVHADRRRVTGSIYFLKLDLSDVIPQSVPQARLINSIARTLGLHDFYQVGLWNYCQGYGNDITECTKPKALYWFNPVEIILSELLAGATIALPTEIIDALDLVRRVSHWMFGLFLTSAPLITLSCLFTPFSARSRWINLPLTILTFLAALTCTIATAIATAMFMIFRNVIKGAEESVNIIPEIGIEMFCFMWIASGCAIIGWLIVFAGCCCCASRRDVVKGKRKGRSAAWRKSGEVPPIEQREKDGGKRGLFGRKKK